MNDYEGQNMLMRRVGRYLRGMGNRLKFRAVHHKYRDFTMMQPNDYVDSLVLISAFERIEGCIVECGVWRGGMIAGMAEVMGNGREYFLFDSFEGLPPAKEIDGATALEWQKNVDSPLYRDNCKAEMDWAKKAMQKSGAEHVHFVKGWFSETIPNHDFDQPIAVLRLDGDWYESTMTCLENLFPKVARGGVIILDDYYAWDGCSKALHDYLSRHQLAERVRSAYTTGCYLVKT